jgi:antitoxin (DNA-binding transcriptional repressor) of toxin-antitoxin stability system
MKVVNIDEAKTHITSILQRVMNGEEILILQSGEAIAKISPVNRATQPRIPGIDADKVVIHDDFDDPLPEFNL